ncbi:Chaperone protein DnaK [Streptomyces xanthophaeus]|nr:Chaperone protein DnaK [Streptomyces xanthophaeus]
MARTVGIDLGTSSSVVAALDGERFVVIPNAEGSSSTPSVVAFTEDGRTLVGEPARRQAVTNVGRTVSSVKRHMGTGWRLAVDGRTYDATQISALILRKLKQDAEAHLGEEISGAVITVPAYFSEAERRATLQAGELAGLHVQRIINEPTAAALACGADWEDQVVLLVHFGGGTFDVSLMEIGDTVVETKATCGDNRLGGDDWDRRVAVWLATRFEEAHGLDLTSDPVAMRRLSEAAERAKIELSSATATEIEVPYVAVSGDGPLHLEQALTRSMFEQLTADLLDRCTGPLRSVFAYAGIQRAEVTRVVLVGGATRMPAVSGLVRALVGAHAPVTLGQSEATVANGAALQAGVLSGHIKDLLLLDVTPFSLGIALTGGEMVRLIERNTTIPTKRSEQFSVTGTEGATAVRIPVCQGESTKAAENDQLGVLELAGRGKKMTIEVAIDIDANGVVTVSAKDLATRAEQSMTLTGVPAQRRQQ